MTEIPTVVTPTKDFKKIQEELDKIEEMVENTNAELYQRTGKKVGRDVGIVYGLVLGMIFLTVFYNIVLPIFLQIK